MKNRTFIKLMLGLTLMLGMMVALSATVYADIPSWESGDCVVEFEGDKLVVSKKTGATGGAMYDYVGAEPRPWDIHRDQIKSLEVKEGVTHIGNNAFYKHEYIIDVSFPRSLRSVGNFAFSGCYSVAGAAFSDNLKEIGEGAFAGTNNLDTVTFEPATAGTGGELTISRKAFVNSYAELAYNGGGTRLFDGRDVLEAGVTMDDVIGNKGKVFSWVVPYPLWVAGIRVTDATLGGDNWNYDPRGRTLTLSGGEISGDHDDAAIYYKDEDNVLTIDGTSTCKVTGPDDTESNKSYGIYTEGDLTIKGDLTVAGANVSDISAGIYGEKSITVSGKLSATGKGISGTGIYFHNNQGSITADEGGKVTAVGDRSGINMVNGHIIINKGAEMYAAGGDTGIGTRAAGNDDNDITIKEGAKLTAVSDSQAIGIMVKNFIGGRGWENATGSGEGDPIEKNEAGTYYDDPGYKKLVFPDNTAAVTAVPTANTLTYSGKAQGLVKAGKAEGGEMQYALGNDGTTVPKDGWSTSIPSRTNVGTYYVWYKAAGDYDHFDSDAACVEATINPKPAPKPEPKKPQTVGKTTIRKTIANSAKKINDVIYDGVPGATGYDIAYKHKNSSNWVIKKVGKTTRGTIGGLTVGGMYQVKVRAKKAETSKYKAATGAWSPTVYRYFHTTEKIRLASKSKGSFTMSWKKNPQATSYQVMFSTNKNGSVAASNINTVGKNATSFTKSGLKSGTTYYVQIRETKKVGGKTYIGNISCPLAVKIR